MPRYLILAQSEFSANALNAWLDFLGEHKLDDGNPGRIVWGREGMPAVEAYETLVKLIDGAAKGGDSTVPVNEVVVLVDSVQPTWLSAVSEGSGWDNLLAMLILSFPEISWHFGVFSGPSDKYDSKKSEDLPDEIFFPDSSHSLTALLTRTYRDPLLDPTGLRQWVRCRTIEALKIAGNSTKLPLRVFRAASIDDERDFARYHGYTAYRFGCRADAVTTWSLMQEKFSNAKEKKTHGYWLLLEDLSLNFPDKQENTHLLCLDKYAYNNSKEPGRATHCPQLDSRDPLVESSSHRVIVTTGPTQSERSIHGKNREYLRKKVKGVGSIIFKPVGGMFDLWAKARLLKKKASSECFGNVKHFVWPLPLPSPENINKTKSGHGSPGKLLLIAETLICRAEGMRENARSVSQAIQGAVLSTDALELTGGRTPTTALQALRLKHEFEVLAECQFSGVEYHYATEPRIKEIDLVVKAICSWFHTTRHEPAVLNAKMRILGSLIQIFRKFGQFDEEQLCMNRVRRLQNSLWVRQNRWRYFVLPVLRYVEFLLSSFAVFIAMLGVWVAFLAILYAWCLGTDSFLDAIEAAITSFFSIGAPVINVSNVCHPDHYYVVISVAVVSGFAHLGIFIAHLYAMLSRK